MRVAGATYKPAGHVQVAECEGEAVLLHAAKGVYYGLDEVGTRVWQMMRDGKSVDEMVRVLLERYDAEEQRLRADVRQLLADLEREGLIEAGEAS